MDLCASKSSKKRANNLIAESKRVIVLDIVVNKCAIFNVRKGTLILINIFNLFSCKV